MAIPITQGPEQPIFRPVRFDRYRGGGGDAWSRKWETGKCCRRKVGRRLNLRVVIKVRERRCERTWEGVGYWVHLAEERTITGWTLETYSQGVEGVTED